MASLPDRGDCQIREGKKMNTKTESLMLSSFLKHYIFHWSSGALTDMGYITWCSTAPQGVHDLKWSSPYLATQVSKEFLPTSIGSSVRGNFIRLWENLREATGVVRGAQVREKHRV